MGEPEASWLEVSLMVDSELVEPVAEVLSRFLSDGIVVESTSVTANPDDSEGHSVGPLRVFGYLPVDDMLETNRQRLEEALWYLGRIRPLPAPQFRLIQQTNWAESWKQHYHPIQIGKRLIVIPAWLEPSTNDRIPVRIDPGMAFGTGTHPTTQLCLEFVEAILTSSQDDPAPQRAEVIDLGCGTAILAVAALKLGAARALGVDIDPEAIKAAVENAASNSVLEHLELGVGSLDEILRGDFSLRTADLVLANILAPVLVRLLDEGLGQLLNPAGQLILSGILAEQSAEVEEAAAKNGLWLVEKRQLGDWVALRVARTPHQI
ncbi:MAG: 50S ribosomal protein L11 methyltransferase [Anaerolineales bacterium]|nr:50S ribosomal protein L11 methyltransferase [Anaerolineales bacterium]